MKKLVSILLAVVLVLSLAACGGSADNGSYTYNLAATVFPTNWNPHIYQTATDSVLLDYIVQGFYTFDYNDTLDGYEVVPAMAKSEPVDVTDKYVGEQWGIAEGDTARAYTITLRKDIKWEDGTAITAQDFVDSAKLLLNPVAQNYRADSLYSGNLVIYNAQNYLNQGSTVLEDNGINNAYAISDLVKGDDGNYYTAAGEPVYIGVDFALDWTGGNTLADYVGAYGTVYFDVSQWDALAALANEDGCVPLNDETNAMLATTTTGNPAWGESNDDLPNYYVVEATYPEMAFEDVGIMATGTYELTIILTKPLSGFYLLYSLTDSWLVNQELYASCESVVDGVYTNTYGTSVETTMSYGPYKLTEFQSDKVFKFEKNSEWYGYNDRENKKLYQTTNIVYNFVPEASTRLEMFLNGELDSYALNADNMATYSKSDYCYYTTGDSTFFMALNPDLEALTSAQASTGANINKTILTVKEFRMALAFGLDRAAFCLATSPTNNAAFAVYSSFIISNPDEGTAYRTTDAAKQVVVDFWGLADDIGEGKTYADIDEAIASITGYNLAMAQDYFNQAYDIAIANGLMDENDVIEIKIGTPNNTSNFYNNGYEFIVNNYTEAVKGTKLEGKLTFTRDDTLGNGFANALRNNQVDMLFGVGWTGSALDPYNLMEAYTSSSYQYDPSWNTTTADLEVEIDGVAYTATVWDWTLAIMGETITITAADGTTKDFSAGDSDGVPELRLELLGALEGAVLETYDLIPLMDDSDAVLKGMKVNFYTEDYIYGIGRGGIKYMSYNFNDEEWAAFVAGQGGTLNYQ